MILVTDLVAMGFLTVAVLYLLFLTYQKKALSLGLLFLGLLVFLWVALVYSYLAGK